MCPCACVHMWKLETDIVCFSSAHHLIYLLLKRFYFYLCVYLCHMSVGAHGSLKRMFEARKKKGFGFPGIKSYRQS